MDEQSERWGKCSESEQVELFLEGPQNRWFDLVRAFSIFVEFIRGFRALHFINPCVTIFGSARFTEENHYYQKAQTLGSELGKLGFTIMTGGGPGIMEAANRGAKQVSAYSVGCNIELPKEQKPNPYLDQWIDFEHFFVRKVMLLKYSYAFIALPGGFGTLDEVFETATLIQTKKMKQFPLVLVGREYWEPLMEFLKRELLARGTISESDLELLFVTDSVEEAVAVVKEYAFSTVGLKQRKKPTKRWWLAET